MSRELPYGEFQRKLAPPIPMDRHLPTIFGQTIRWTDLGGDEHAVRVNGCTSPQEALKEATRMACEMGWTPRRWWQFWRYSDTKVPFPVPDKEK